MKVREKSAPDISQFKTLLKAKNLKATPQRLAVHQAMLALGHASADTVADYMHENCGTSVTIASVYNILSTLADLKIYNRRMSSNNKMYFDVNTFKHLHLYDCEGNKFKDVIDDELIEMVEAHFKGRRFRGYTVEGFDVQIICHPTARNKKAQG